MNYRKYLNLGILVTFVFYIMIVFYVVFLKNRFVLGSLNYGNSFEFYWKNNVNLTPLKTIKNYMVYENNLSDNLKYMNILGNIILFIPFGTLLPVLIKKFKFLKTVGSAILFSCIIELLQMTFRIGSLDIDDVILNFIGAFMGYFIYAIIINYIRLTRVWKTK